MRIPLRLDGRGPRLLITCVVLALVAGVLLVLVPGLGSNDRTLTATFPRTINLYRGAQVKVLGVRVGKVTSVKVVGSSVRVQMTYADDVHLPNDVHAMIVPPSIVGDRFVQLAPAWRSGPVLADGAQIGLSRTEVPLELDDTYRQLDGLSVALGPRGANKLGALSRLVHASAGALDGNGRQFHQSLGDLASALDTLSAVDGNYQQTVDHTGTLTRTLQANDANLRRLVVSLARVSATLDGQRQDIRQASTDLSGALSDVAAFTKANRGRVTGTVKGLRDVSTTLHRRVNDLDDLLTLAPIGFVDAMNINVPTNYDLARAKGAALPGRTTSFAQRGIFTTNVGTQLSSVLTSVCQTATGPQQAQLAPLCTALAAAGYDLGLLLSQMANDGKPSNGPNASRKGATPDPQQFLAKLRRLAAAEKAAGR
jgi:phospholipid/cholesterol/gamma-HCH transport system substrate-binding protein